MVYQDAGETDEVYPADRADGVRTSGVAVSARLLLGLCSLTLKIDGAAITLRGTGSASQLLYASNTVVDRLGDLEFVVGEGPSEDALRCRTPVTEINLRSAAAALRWPLFARDAVTAGAGSVFVFPLQVGAVLFGVLYLYRSAAGPLTDDQWTQALALTDMAASEVLAAFADDAGVTSDLDSWAAEAGPSLVPQATGMIAVQRGIGVAQALAELRGAAYSAERPVTELAADVVERRTSFAD